MDLQSVLSELEMCGTEQDRLELAQQGVIGPMYGVNRGRLYTIRDRIGTDHILASSLWATGNHDARVLATLVADSAQVDDAIIAAWSAEAGDAVISAAVQELASRMIPRSQLETSVVELDETPIDHNSEPLAADPPPSVFARNPKPAKTARRVAKKKSGIKAARKKKTPARRKSTKPSKKSKRKSVKKASVKKNAGKKSVRKSKAKSTKKAAKKSKARKK